MVQGRTQVLNKQLILVKRNEDLGSEVKLHNFLSNKTRNNRNTVFINN